MTTPSEACLYVLQAECFEHTSRPYSIYKQEPTNPKPLKPVPEMHDNTFSAEAELPYQIRILGTPQQSLNLTFPAPTSLAAAVEQNLLEFSTTLHGPSGSNPISSRLDCLSLNLPEAHN